MTNRVKISRSREAVPKSGSYKVEYPGGVEHFYYDDEPSRRLRAEIMTSEQALEKAKTFAREKQAAAIEVYTERYEREHGSKPAGRRFWSFVITSPTNTAEDHFKTMDKPMTYEAALEEAKRIAQLRRSERIIVEP